MKTIEDAFSPPVRAIDVFRGRSCNGRNMEIETAARLLEVSWPVSLDGPKAAYRKQMRKSHPDRFNNEEDRATATRQTQCINCAFEVLCEASEEAVVGRKETKREAEGRATANGNGPRHTYRGKKFTPGFPDETVVEWFVRSSWIISVGYNEQIVRMFVKTDNNQVYFYYEVPRSVFEGLVSASSPGRYMHAHVFGEFSWGYGSSPT